MIIKPFFSSFIQASTLSVLLGGMSFLGANTAIAQEVRPRTLTVTGRAMEMVPTSLSQVRLGIEIEGKTAQEVQAQVGQRSNDLVDLLQGLAVDKLQTTGINLQPTYSYTDNQRQLVGYVGTNTVSFEVATDKAGLTMDQAIKTGATRIDGISFIATSDAIAEAEKLALVAATRDAQNQAEQVLAALNLQAQEIIAIRIGETLPSSPSFAPLRTFEQVSSSPATVEIVGGEELVRATVTLDISY